MKIAVGIPTYGRASILAATVADLVRQSRAPDRVIVCCARQEDASQEVREDPRVEILFSKPGLCAQRNAIIDAVQDCDLLLFLDDDFLMREDYVAVMERLFAARPGVLMATGTVLADGVCRPGITFAEARVIIAESGPCPEPLRTMPVRNGYGCNMMVRLAPIRRIGLRFDERMPLYAWQEDVEFSCRLATHGGILRVDGARGVHLGVKAGRTPGLQLGYSQVINPFYIARRVPAYTVRRAVAQVGRNLAANLIHAAKPEPWIDRRGRLRGNVIGLFDLLRGRLVPERVLALGARVAGLPPDGGRKVSFASSKRSSTTP